MLVQRTDLPPNVIGFIAEGEVTADDFKNVLLPAVEQHMKSYEELNYMLTLPEDLPNFTAGAWMQDAWLGLKNLTNWNRGAIMSDNETVKNITSIFSKMVPGEFRVYEKVREQEAIDWLSGATK